MLSRNNARLRTSIVMVVALVFFPGLCRTQQKPPTPEFSLSVVVREAETGNPMSQARLTLTFKSGKLRRTVSYGAKTNAQGRYRFTGIPKGTVLLSVTAEHRQSYGKEFELEQDNQEIEVKLKKPQPQL